MAIQKHSLSKSDRRVIRTRKAIMEAFNTLICEGDIKKITVSAIAREADIDRKTFYLHYSSIDELADRKTEEAIERVLNALKTKGANKTDVERLHIVLEEVNSILLSDVTVYANIASSLSVDQILKRLQRAAEPALVHTGADITTPTTSKERMQLRFYLAGAWSLYWIWLKGDHRQPIEEISQIIEQILEVPLIQNSSIFKFDSWLTRVRSEIKEQETYHQTLSRHV